jgi:hypothetical protein
MWNKNARHYDSICLERLKKNYKILKRNSRSAGRYIDQRPSEHKAGVLTSRLQLSISSSFIGSSLLWRMSLTEGTAVCPQSRGPSHSENTTDFHGGQKKEEKGERLSGDIAEKEKKVAGQGYHW